MTTEITDFIKLTADSGLELTNGLETGNIIILPLGSDLSKWSEVSPKTEKEKQIEDLKNEFYNRLNEIV